MPQIFSDSSSDSEELFWSIVNSESDEELERLELVALQNEQENMEIGMRKRRGSIKGHVYINRRRLDGHQRLYNDYFAEHPVYSSTQFRRRFRMRRPLFLRIVSAVEAYDSYFAQKRDRSGRLGLSPLQKVTAAMRMIAYGVAADAVDDYVRISETTSIEALERFVEAIIVIFGDTYLRRPNANDISRLLVEGESRGFPGMLGSIDCMHWTWKNCPYALKGMYTRGDHRKPSLILEAMASKDLWIWHAFFGIPGSHNDINVLEHSPLFSDLREGRAPPANFSINGHNYTMGYYLADGIYPSWATLVKTIPCPQGPKAKNFAAAQESARKDVERAFGVLQARFAIIRGPARSWDRNTLRRIMKACIIMHNMIVEDERDERLSQDYDVREGESNDINMSREHTAQFQEFIQNYLRIRDRGIHNRLQEDLVEHLWQRQGGSMQRFNAM